MACSTPRLHDDRRHASVLIEANQPADRIANLHVVVLPEINAGSASVLYAFIANPAIGIGTFLAHWLLRHPLSKIFPMSTTSPGRGPSRR